MEIDQWINGVLSSELHRQSATTAAAMVPESDHVSKINRARSYFKSHMRRADRILSALLEKLALTKEEYDQIRSEGDTSEVIECLLDVLELKPVSAYQCFLDALRSADQDYLCRALEERVCHNEPHQTDLADLTDEWPLLYCSGRLARAMPKLLDNLLKGGVIDEMEVTEIKSFRSIQQSSEFLYDLVLRSSPEQLRQAVESLKVILGIEQLQQITFDNAVEIKKQNQMLGGFETFPTAGESRTTVGFSDARQVVKLCFYASTDEEAIFWQRLAIIERLRPVLVNGWKLELIRLRTKSTWEFQMGTEGRDDTERKILLERRGGGLNFDVRRRSRSRDMRRRSRSRDVRRGSRSRDMRRRSRSRDVRRRSRSRDMRRRSRSRDVRQRSRSRDMRRRSRSRDVRRRSRSRDMRRRSRSRDVRRRSRSRDMRRRSRSRDVRRRSRSRDMRRRSRSWDVRQRSRSCDVRQRSRSGGRGRSTSVDTKERSRSGSRQSSRSGDARRRSRSSSASRLSRGDRSHMSESVFGINERRRSFANESYKKNENSGIENRMTVMSDKSLVEVVSVDKMKTKSVTDANITEYIIPFSQLKLEQELASGGFGNIWKAMYSNQKAPVVYKKFALHLESTATGGAKKCEDGLKSQAVIHLCLRQVNIISLLGIVFEEQNYGVVYEYATYGSLKEFLKRNGKYSLKQEVKIKIALDISAGMRYLHHPRIRILHLNLSLHNILIGENTIIKVSDYGLSKWKKLGYSLRNCSLVQRDLSCIPPEKLADPYFPPNAKYDVYSYGILVWKLFTEETPYEQVKDLIHNRVLSGIRPSIDRQSLKSLPEIANLIVECWDQEHAKRPTFEGIVGPTCAETELMVCARPNAGDFVSDSCDKAILYWRQQAQVELSYAQPNHQQKIRRCYSQLVDCMRRTTKILDHLFEVGELNDLDKPRKLMMRRLQMVEVDLIKALLDWLIDQPFSTYEAFLHALNHTRQAHIYQLLEEEVPVDTSHKDKVQSNYNYLLMNLDIESGGVLDRLYAAHVLDEDEMNELRMMTVLRDRIRRLLFFVSRSTSEQFQLFLETLPSYIVKDLI